MLIFLRFNIVLITVLFKRNSKGYTQKKKQLFFCFYTRSIKVPVLMSLAKQLNTNDVCYFVSIKWGGGSYPWTILLVVYRLRISFSIDIFQMTTTFNPSLIVLNNPYIGRIGLSQHFLPSVSAFDVQLLGQW